MDQPVDDCRFMKSISFYGNSTALDENVFLIGFFYHSCLTLACPSEFHALHESFSSRVNHLHSWESMDSKHYYFLSGHDERTLVLIKHFIILTDQLSDCLAKKNIWTTFKACSFLYITRLPLSDLYFENSIQFNKNSNLIILLKGSKRPASACP